MQASDSVTVQASDSVTVRAWGSEWQAPDHGAYEFSNGRKFDSTDRSSTGIYNPNLGTP